MRRLVAVDQVGHEQAAEEHDFGDQEHPHAERGRLELLLHVVEMVLQVRMMRRVAVRRPDGPRPARGIAGTVPVRRVQTMPTSWLGAYWCVPCVTIGVAAKFSVGGGEGISHSSPRAPHGLAGERRVLAATTAK